MGEVGLERLGGRIHGLPRLVRAVGSEVRPVSRCEQRVSILRQTPLLPASRKPKTRGGFGVPRSQLRSAGVASCEIGCDAVWPCLLEGGPFLRSIDPRSAGCAHSFDKVVDTRRFRTVSRHRGGACDRRRCSGNCREVRSGSAQELRPRQSLYNAQLLNYPILRVGPDAGHERREDRCDGSQVFLFAWLFVLALAMPAFGQTPTRTPTKGSPELEQDERRQRRRNGGSLPFTGLELAVVALAGVGLLGTGIAVRRATRLRDSRP